MAVPEWLTAVLPGHTGEAWEALAELLPADAYLGGGTAVAAHLQHRVSRDLDVFFERSPLLDDIEAELHSRGPTMVTRRAEGTLDCIFSSTKVQLFDAAHCILVEVPTTVAGLRVAGLGDLMAMKLKAITDRGEHRDYYDLAAIELDGRRTLEEGIAVLIARFKPANPDEAAATVLRALAYLGDVEDDPAIPVTIEELQSYLSARIPRITGYLDRSGYLRVEPSSGREMYATVTDQEAENAPTTIGPHRSPNGKCRARTKKRRSCPFDALSGVGWCGVHRWR